MPLGGVSLYMKCEVGLRVKHYLYHVFFCLSDSTCQYLVVYSCWNVCSMKTFIVMAVRIIYKCTACYTSGWMVKLYACAPSFLKHIIERL